MNTTNPVVHFELPGDDMERMKKFYSGAFGWEMEQMGADMGNYVVVTTSETDENKMVKKGGTINGGFYKKTADPISQHPSVVIGVPDIYAAIENVKKAGGTVIGGMKRDGTPDEIPGVGLFASILDTEGNRISIMQPRQK